MAKVKQEKESVQKIKASKDSKAIKKAPKTTEIKHKLSKRFNKLRIRSADLTSKGIVYIGHLPKGFAEEELKKFFN